MKDGRRRDRGWRSLLRYMRLPLCMFAILAVLAWAGVLLMRSTLLRNAREAATAFARSCAAEEQRTLNVYETLLSFGTSALERRLADGESREQILEFLDMYFTRVDSVLGEGVVYPYVVLDGEILAALPWEGDATYRYAATPWYRQALAAEGEVVFTQVYSDVVYDRPVVTAAQSCWDGAVVMAFDIMPEHLRFDTADLSEEDSFFLCDGAGTLIYQQTGIELPQEGLQDYLTGLVGRIKAGELDENPIIRDLSGQRRGVYYTRPENGWYCIVTVPYSRILGGLRGVVWPLPLMFGISFLAVTALAVREQRLNRQARRANETARVLGNRYYALYRVDYVRETYEMIKGSDHVRQRIPPSGPYGQLLQAAGDVIEEEAFRDYTESFSCENIRQLVRRQVRDFGGEFLRRFGDEYRWVSVRVLFDASLAPEEVVLCFREVEREKQRQLQERRLLEESLQLARQNEASKQAFFRSMSHDMRTPLNTILGSSQLARRHLARPERITEDLDRIDLAGRYLLELVNDILEFARMEHGQLRLESQPFDLRTCVEECLRGFRIQAEQEGKSLREEFQADCTLVLGDCLRIQQILNNLISNAFKFTPAGGSVCLEVRQLDEGEYAKYRFAVSDTGIGISPEFLERIFEPYAREMRFSDRQAAGTGLGMSITKTLVTHMEGEIRVESTPGQGSTFTVILPLAAQREPGTVRQHPQPETGEACLTGLHLLLAEDNEINLEITTELLIANGAQVTCARDGAQALEQFRQSEPFTFDLVLMDMQMPEMDGCTAARAIRALDRPDAGTIPIVAVTANASAEDVAATTAAGMDGHISKPIEFRALSRILDRLRPGR